VSAGGRGHMLGACLLRIYARHGASRFTRLASVAHGHSLDNNLNPLHLVWWVTTTHKQVDEVLHSTIIILLESKKKKQEVHACMLA
jgi:hypothetical protein